MPRIRWINEICLSELKLTCLYFQKGWSPLHYASRYGFLEVVQLLVESGADPCTLSKDEKVPLCAAAAAGHSNVLSFLLKKEHDTLKLMDDKTVRI